MSFLRNIILVVALVFICTIFYWAIFIPKEEVSQKIYQTIKEQEKRADLSFKQVTFEENAGGIKYWQLVAETAMINNDQGIASLKNAQGTFFKGGKPSLRFRSPAALWNMKAKEIYLDRPIGYDIVLEGKISRIISALKNQPLSIFNLPEIYKNGPGYWFQAKNLSWKLQDQELQCTGGIVLNKGEVTGRADKLSGDVALETVQLEGNATLTIKPLLGSPATVEAAAFEIQSLTNTILARGNPRIKWENAMITANEVKYFQPGKQFHLSGNVQLSFQEIQAAGAGAVYSVFPQQFILSGKAWARQGDNNLSGDRIVVYLKEKKISLAGRSRVVITEEEIKK